MTDITEQVARLRYGKDYEYACRTKCHRDICDCFQSSQPELREAAAKWIAAVRAADREAGKVLLDRELVDTARGLMVVGNNEELAVYKQLAKALKEAGDD